MSIDSKLLMARLIIMAYFVLSANVVPMHALKDSQLPSMDEMMIKWLKQVPESLLPMSKEMWQASLHQVASLYLPVLADPGPCQTHSQYTLSRVLEADPWALSMLDASSRPGPGLLEGRIQDLGDYDQCLRIREPSDQFSIQHCLVDLKRALSPDMIHQFLQSGVNGTFPMAYVSFSLCVPASCSTDDVKTHVERTLQAANLTLPPQAFIDTYCTRDRPNLRLKDKLAISLFGLIAVFVLFSTAYDWYTPGSKSVMLSSFSVLKGWRELSDCSVTPDITCLDGLRLLCAFAVLTTHRLLLYFFVPYINFATYLEQRGGMLHAVVGSGSMATETFFLINGLTRAYSFLKAKRQGKPTNHLYQSIQRYFRFIPVLGVMVLLTSTLAIHVSDGPIWLRCIGFDATLCNHLWFLNLLLISNWFLYKCRIESWFVAADFQLYLVSPLVLNPLHDEPKKGFTILSLIFVTCVFSKMTTSYVSLLYPDIVTNIGSSPDRHFSHAHSNTFFRVPPYILGIILAYILHQNTYGIRKVSLPKWAVWTGWLLSAGVILTTPLLHSIFFQPDYQDNPWLSVLYVGLWEHLFAAAVGWIILASTLGYGGWVNKVLSLPALRPLAKLSFGLYMTHMSFQGLTIMRMRQPLDFNILETLHLCCADVVVAFLLGTVMYLTVETPCNRVISHLLRHKLSNKHNTKDKKKKR